jgi:S1-C subfamily serine protease
MPLNTRFSNFLSGLLGALSVVCLVGVLFAAGVFSTGGGDDPEPGGSAAAPAPSNSGSSRGPVTSGSIADIYDRVSPGVVFVEARSRTAGSSRTPFGPGRREAQATGSGFVIDDEGFIVTNEHVVGDARDVRVRFGEEDPVKAEVVGADASTDIGVLKIDPGEVKDLKPLELAESKDLRVGDPTIAIGNPFGLDRTVTTGIVSALQREIRAPNGFTIPNVVQTDAAINPGNSGGPLLDERGRVIGVNSQIATGGGANGFQGVGFAVPSDTVKEVVPKLKQDGKVDRGYLGVSTAEVTEDIQRALKLPTRKGALVQEVTGGGPAAKAGIKGGSGTPRENVLPGGDLIVKVDGKDVESPDELGSIIAGKKPGAEVTIEYMRGDDRRSARVKLGSRPDERP